METEKAKSGHEGWMKREGKAKKRRKFSLVLTFSIFIFQFYSTPQALADDSPKHAERGVQAYQAGKHDLARMFFAKALQDAVLKGKEEWVAKATLNLVDLELEAMEESEAERLLEGFTSRDAGIRSLVLWKKSQLAFLRRRHGQALSLIDSALQLAGSKDRVRETALKLDRLRYRIAHQDPAEWAGDYETLRLRLSAEPGKAAGLDAAAAMARKDFARADTLWKQAIAWHRERGRLATVAACMNQSAIALFSLGRREDALEMNGRAVAVFAGMGLAMPGLRAQALRLQLTDDDRERAKLKQDMDLVGQRLSGFDLQGILDEYSQSLRGAPYFRPDP
jgi:hypothetical protein